MLGLIKKMTICLLLINQSSCYQSRKIEIKTISNFCYLHTPINNDLDFQVVDYWEKIGKIIDHKNKNNLLKNSEERFAEVMINYAASNDKKYYDKKCDQINNN
jgi:hypothetical protein